ncbi:MAG: lysophospholipid acyltransferase family protein [Betaproteobacteria bacterium]|nr:lysophospholipid acyltransferase family protein [Betaproteobacteria bacterium]
MKGAGILRSVLAACGWLPAPLAAGLGSVLGLFGYLLHGKRRRIVHVNLRLMFPQRAQIWRAGQALIHFMYFGRFIVEHGILLVASARRLRRLVHISGLEHLRAVRGKPAIIVVPHFLGLEFGAVRIGLEQPLDAGAQPQHSAAFERLVNECRSRACEDFVELDIGSLAGMRAALRRLKSGRSLFYLPDMDFGGRGKSVFLPFLGVPHVAVATTLPRLARASGAQVLFCFCRMRPLGGYSISVQAPLADYPDADDSRAMQRIHDLLEPLVRSYPAQYYLMHRRFKTQPAGLPNPYG